MRNADYNSYKHVEHYGFIPMARVMRTVQITIDSTLLEKVDAAVQELGASRSAFIRSALILALQRHTLAKQETRHAAGYAAHPVQPGEFDGWEPEQVWGER